MEEYFLNIGTTRNPGGHNEVHKISCPYFPSRAESLGMFSSCHGAVKEAKARGYKKADGCKVCSPSCHTG